MWPISDETFQRHKPATARNVALVIQTQLDQMMAEARDAKLDNLMRKLDAAFEQATDDIKEMDNGI